jgi:hypothetical protein
LSRAHFTFHGHYVQTTTQVDFEAYLSVNFADPLLTTQDEQKLNP